MLDTTAQFTHPDADGLRTPYLVQGLEDGIPLVLLHGNLGSKRWWLPLFDIMPQEFRLLAPDLRGCGQFLGPFQDFSVNAQCQDLQRFIDCLELRRFTLVAHSTSCAPALEYAVRFPHRLESLVLVSSPPLTGTITDPQAYRKLQSLLRDKAGMTELLQNLLPGLDQRSSHDQDLMADLVQDALACLPRAVDGITRSLETWSFQDRAMELQMPLLLMRGQADPIMPHETALRTLLSIPNANNLEVIQGAGYAPWIENTTAFAIRLIEFVVQDINDQITLPPAP